MKSDKLNKPVTYIKGVGPLKGDLLQKEFNIFTVYDLLFNFPFRYVDSLLKFIEIQYNVWFWKGLSS